MTGRTVFEHALVSVSIVEDFTAAHLIPNGERVYEPQPKTGVPGTGDLTLAVLGDIGVVGRADMLIVVDQPGPRRT